MENVYFDSIRLKEIKLNLESRANEHERYLNHPLAPLRKGNNFRSSRASVKISRSQRPNIDLP